jgi:hypothetical protein
MKEACFNTNVTEAALVHNGKNEVRRAYNRPMYLDAQIELMDWWGHALHQLII